MKNLKTQKGFTLIEMLVAMSIFMVFTGILMGSYTNIIRTQREAEDYRIMYSEARKVFDSIIGELRDGIVDYSCDTSVQFLAAGDKIELISKDGASKTRIFLETEADKPGIVKIGRGETYQESVVELNSELVNVKELQFFPYPVLNPYDDENVAKAAVQFQPKVTVYAVFEKERRNGDVFELKLQTTVSSRIYNQVKICPQI